MPTLKKKLLIIGSCGAVGLMGLAAFYYLTWQAPGFDRKMNRLPAELLQGLYDAEKFTLLSLNPVEVDPVSNTNATYFYKHQILGKSTVTDAKLKNDLIASLQSGISNSRGIGYMCFNPRHGIRAERGTNRIDVVICFECAEVQVVFGPTNQSFLTTKVPSKIFNHALEKLRLPVSKE